LVAPVTTQGARQREVYFPQGASWVDYFNSSAVYSGGKSYTVPAPLEILPLFKRI
jgi:alpha-glucosidase (family GH31 glycosyl hydrolase)